MNCLPNFKNQDEKLLDLLLLDRNLFELDNLPNRRIQGKLMDLNDNVISDSKISISKIEKRNFLNKVYETNSEGDFSVDLKISVTTFIVIKNNETIGTFILKIKENEILYESEKFKIINLTSIYLYPSGYTEPIIFSNAMISEKYFGEYYLNIELVNVANYELNFISSEIISKTSGVKIKHPFDDNNNIKNENNKKYPGVRMKIGEYRSIINYTKHFWRYSNNIFDNEKNIRFFKPTNLKPTLYYDYGKKEYFIITMDDDIIKDLKLEIILLEDNGKKHTITFSVKM